MDKKTIESYDVSHQEIAKLHNSLLPHELYDLALNYFSPNSAVLDVGCGIGRDCSWLSNNGFISRGIDASVGMLKSAQENHPDILFSQDSLPEINTIKDETFPNVLCSAVIMHLPSDCIKQSISNLLRVAQREGIILLTYRGTSSRDNRESGKLYTPLEPSAFTTLFEDCGAHLVFHNQSIEQGRGHTWNNFVFRK